MDKKKLRWIIISVAAVFSIVTTTLSLLVLDPTPSPYINKHLSNDQTFNKVFVESFRNIKESKEIEYSLNQDSLNQLLINLEEKKDYNPRVKEYAKLNDRTLEEREAYIKSNPHFGKVVCSCEKVSLGEIEELLTRSVPPTTVKGVKRRVRAGFGKCQGGFCSPVVTLLLAKHYGVSPTEIKWDKDGSEILKEEVKK